MVELANNYYQCLIPDGWKRLEGRGWYNPESKDWTASRGLIFPEATVVDMFSHYFPK